MISKTIMILAIAAAFSIGLTVSPGVVNAHLDMCAQPSADSLKSVWHALCDLQNEIDTIELTPGPQGEQGPPGADGSMVRTIRTVVTPGPIIGGEGGAEIISQTFTVSKDATIFVSASANSYNTETVLRLILDGDLTPLVLSGGIPPFDSGELHWTGPVSQGTHTLSFQTATGFVWADPDRTAMNILIIE